MNTTLKQQTAAVKKSYQRAVLASQPDKYCKELNDACSTLAAVAMIGEDTIKLIPQMIKLLDKSYGVLLRITPWEGVLKDDLEEILDKLQPQNKLKS